MTTWTPATQQPETWTSEAPDSRVFSPLVFSRALSGGLRVFDVGGGGLEIWDDATTQSETWTPA